MRKRITSLDVAKHAGVSQATVSSVLNQRLNSRISTETQRRVMKSAKDLNYVTNNSARSLITGKTFRLSVLPKDPSSFQMNGSYYSLVLHGLIQGAMDVGYNLLLHTGLYTDTNVLRAEILNGSSDGILIIGRSNETELAEMLSDSEFPTVLVNAIPENNKYTAVDCDNEMGGYLATQYLLELGHRVIGIQWDGGTNSWIRERYVGAERAMREFGMNESELIKFYHNSNSPASDIEEGRRFNLSIIDKLDEISAVLVWVEEIAAELVLELAKAGKSVPNDLSIITFNSSIVSAQNNPPITSVSQPFEDIGRTAVRKLLDIMNHKEVTSRVERLPVKLDIRDSCCKHQG